MPPPMPGGGRSTGHPDPARFIPMTIDARLSTGPPGIPASHHNVVSRRSTSGAAPGPCPIRPIDHRPMLARSESTRMTSARSFTGRNDGGRQHSPSCQFRRKI